MLVAEKCKNLTYTNKQHRSHVQYAILMPKLLYQASQNWQLSVWQTTFK